MKYFLSIFLMCLGYISYGQKEVSIQNSTTNNFKYLEFRAHFGAFLKAKNNIGQSGLLDNGYGGVTIKMGWQPTDPEDWASRYNYPSYGVGFYSGFLSDAKVFGNPNAVYGFIRFPLSSSDKKMSFLLNLL